MFVLNRLNSKTASYRYDCSPKKLWYNYRKLNSMGTVSVLLTMYDLKLTKKKKKSIGHLDPISLLRWTSLIIW